MEMPIIPDKIIEKDIWMGPFEYEPLKQEEKHYPLLDSIKLYNGNYYEGQWKEKTERSGHGLELDNNGDFY